MPRWLRQFTFNQINEFYKKEAETHEKVVSSNKNSSTLIDPSGKINKENWKSVQNPKVTPGPPKTRYK